MQVTFFLNSQKKSKAGNCPVYMSITFNGKRIRKPVTGVSCPEKTWDSKRQRMRLTKNDPFDETASYNNRLDYIQTQLKQIKQSAFDRRVKITEKFILDRLQNEDLIKADKFDFFAISDLYLNSIRPMKAERTIKGKISAFNFLRAFEIHNEEKLGFHSMNLDFFESLQAYAFSIRKIEDNYFAKIIAVLKAYLNWAFDRDYIKDQVYKKFKATEKETEIICLTLEEFLLLKNHNFTSKRLEHVRDVFIFGCSTGFRFSDIITLKSEHIGADYIVKNIQKTKETATIPLNKYSREVIDKYKDSIYAPLPKVSHQKFNQYLKDCCEAAGIDSPLTITRFSGGTRKETSYLKYQLITSHVARKTFTTLSLILGVPERVVKNITGHKKDKNFSRYVNFSKEYEKNQLAKAWGDI